MVFYTLFWNDTELVSWQTFPFRYFACFISWMLLTSVGPYGRFLHLRLSWLENIIYLPPWIFAWLQRGQITFGDVHMRVHLYLEEKIVVITRSDRPQNETISPLFHSFDCLFHAFHLLILACFQCIRRTVSLRDVLSITSIKQIFVFHLSFASLVGAYTCMTDVLMYLDQNLAVIIPPLIGVHSWSDLDASFDQFCQS